MEEYYSAIQQEKRSMRSSINTDVPRWMAPPCGAFKINWDASIDKALMGVGIIVRDYVVQVMATMCSSKPYSMDSTVAKAYTS